MIRQLCYDVLEAPRIEPVKLVEVGRAGKVAKRPFIGGSNFIKLLKNGPRCLEVLRRRERDSFKCSVRSSLPCAECGYPVVEPDLRWHPRIYVTGPLAELELGPASRNISGARRAADRIVASLHDDVVDDRRAESTLAGFFQRALN